MVLDCPAESQRGATPNNRSKRCVLPAELSQSIRSMGITGLLTRKETLFVKVANITASQAHIFAEKLSHFVIR